MRTEERDEHALEALALSFVAHRPRLHAIAQRALGSPWSADDAVQDTWIRLQSADAETIEDLEAWLTTVVSRVCIDLIRHGARRPEQPAEEPADERAGRGTSPRRCCAPRSSPWRWTWCWSVSVRANGSR